MNILVVDEDAGVRDLLSGTMRKLGHDVVCVSNGRQAVDHVKQNHVDLSYIDVNLPDGDGFRVLWAMRKIRPKLGGVMLSRVGMRRLLEQMLMNPDGIFWCATKPLTAERTEYITTCFGQALP
ncbi:MAG: response regulator [Deltaproteobacteria bacterium]|nr:response regulator [Candidatus Zymogenaceae bacterium]